MPATKPEWLVVGKITGPHGIKGWVKIHSFTDPDTNILDFRDLRIQRGDTWEAIEIDDGRRQGKGIVAHVVGCDDRNNAALLAQCQLSVSEQELPALAEDDFYWRQLQGLSVYAGSEQEPILLGRIAYLFATGANDVMVVQGTDESIDSKERLIPWVPGEHVIEVDLPTARVRVDWDPEF